MEDINFSTHSVNSALETQSTAINQIMSSALVNQEHLNVKNEQLRVGAMLEQGKGQNINLVG